MFFRVASDNGGFIRVVFVIDQRKSENSLNQTIRVVAVASAVKRMTDTTTYEV